MQGIILKGVGGLYEVVTASEEHLNCRAAGKIRLTGQKPLPGDRVDVQKDGEEGYIHEILPRKNVLVRPAVANIDALVIAIAPQAPQPDFFMADTLTVQCEMAGIMPIICVTKSDLDRQDAVASIAKVYRSAGYPVVVTSSQMREGREEMLCLIRGKTTAFTGNSGVGKSTLLNLLLGECLKTGDISQKTNRGRHTTRHTELFPLEGGYVLDTPGFSAVFEPEVEPEHLADCFPEFKKLPPCRFPDCTHTKEPKCSVISALSQGIVAQSRYESYCTLYQKRRDAVKQYKKKKGSYYDD